MKTTHTNSFVLSICAALVFAITGCHQQPQSAPAQDEAAQVAAIQKQQQDAAAEAKHDAELRKQVEENKKKSRAWNKGGSKTWQTYVP